MQGAACALSTKHGCFLAMLSVVPGPTNTDDASPMSLSSIQTPELMWRAMEMKSGMPSSPVSGGSDKATLTDRVRLVNSFTAIAAVLHAVLETRVLQGNTLLALAARTNGEIDLKATHTSPAPQLSVAGFERTQFEAALCPPTDCPFTSEVPGISVQDYVTRLLSVKPSFSNAVYILMVALLDKAMLYNPHLFLHGANAHRMILAAFVVAVKYHEDCSARNADFASIGLVSVDELNTLEVAFLNALDWRCHVSKERFEEVEECVVHEALGSPQWFSVLETLRDEQCVEMDGGDGATSPVSPLNSFGVCLSSSYSGVGRERFLASQMLTSDMELSAMGVPRMFDIGEGVGPEYWGNGEVARAAVEYVLSDIDPFEGMDSEVEEHENFFDSPGVVRATEHEVEGRHAVAVFDFVFRGIDRYDFDWPSWL